MARFLHRLFSDLVDEHAFEVCAQDLVVTEAALTIERLGEKAATMQFEKDRLAPLPSEIPVAELSVQHSEHGGRGEELADHARARAEGTKHAAAFVAAAIACCEMEEMQPRGPPVGAACEFCQLVRTHRLPIEVTKELLNL